MRVKLFPLSVLLNALLLLYLLLPRPPVKRVIRSTDGKPSQHVVPWYEKKTTSGDTLGRKMYPDLHQCGGNPSLRHRKYQRGEHWVLENYFPAGHTFPCNDSITYTTHGDYTFLENLEPLTSRWQGPVSMAIYAPGKDFQATIDAIAFLRSCGSQDIKKFVSFHLIFPTSHFPDEIPTQEDLSEREVDCEQRPTMPVNGTTYRLQGGLLYPINVARNAAREAARTYFVLASDVELYPSTGLAPEFFKMLRKPDASPTVNPRVYVLPVFEVKVGEQPPLTKTELKKMLFKRKAIVFHQHVCKMCHTVPKSTKWTRSPVKPGLSVFHIGKRHAPYSKWEPIYVGTNKEPLYDERLSWEGQSDKMTQMYALCTQDYEFHILDNAFLVHKPGIKKRQKNPARGVLVDQQNAVIKEEMVPQYKRLFGNKTKCVL